MKNKVSDSITVIKKIKARNVLPFILWPAIFVAGFFMIYGRFARLYVSTAEYRGAVAAGSIVDTFSVYLNNVDSTLKTCSATVEYMMANNATDEEILDYITYESESMGIVSSTGSRGIFGLFGGTFMDGIEWDPGPEYKPRERLWYQVAKENNGRYGFAGPYFNLRTNEYVVTACKLLDDGDSAIAFAIDYSTFTKMTTALFAGDESRTVIIMTDDGTVMANSKEEELGVDYSTSEDPFKKAIYDTWQKNKGRSTFGLHPDNKPRASYIISQRHLIYDMNVLTITNADLEMGGLRKSAAFFGIVMFGGMLIILVLNFFGMSKDIEARSFAENLKSIANIYVTMHKINLVEDSYEQIMCNDYRVSKFIEASSKKCSESIVSVMSSISEERTRDQILKFVDLSTLGERMKGVNTITEEYLNVDHLWHRARFIVVDRASDGTLKRVIFATELIDDEKRDRDKLKYLAETDQLTGINNRGSGEAKIRDLLTKNVGGMFLMFDVDKFKHVNDNYGHDTGDMVLIRIAEKMRHNFRDKDIIMRLGGDEFAAYMPGIAKQEDGRVVVDRFIQSVEAIKIENAEDLKISISIGAALYYPTDTFSFEELYRRADVCTYESKKIKGSAFTGYKRMDSAFIEQE